MTVVSDTNILSSLAAADAVAAIQRLFVRSRIRVPPAVHDELQAAIDRGRTYLAPVIDAIAAGDIPVLAVKCQLDLPPVLPHERILLC